MTLIPILSLFDTRNFLSKKCFKEKHLDNLREFNDRKSKLLHYIQIEMRARFAIAITNYGFSQNIKKNITRRLHTQTQKKNKNKNILYKNSKPWRLRKEKIFVRCFLEVSNFITTERSQTFVTQSRITSVSRFFFHSDSRQFILTP